MDVTLIYKGNSFVYNISPLMPISYLRTLAHKSFNLPEYLINLSYQDSNIERQYYEISLNEYFKSKHIVILINKIEPKNFFSHSLTATNITSSVKSLKTLNIDTNIKKIYERNYSNSKINDKCQECLKRKIQYFCRESSKFICEICHNKHHSRHKFIKIEKGNFEQSFYCYQKQLIEELDNEKKQVNNLLEKSSEDKLSSLIEKVFDILEKINNQEREILQNYPSVPLNLINETDFVEIKQRIYSINAQCKSDNPYFLKNYSKFYKDLYKEDCKIESLKKDIESVEKKYNFQDMVNIFIESVNNKLKDFYNTLNSIWVNYRYNIFEFSKQMENLEKKINKNYIFHDIESETDDDNTEKIESELEEIKSENRKVSNKNGQLIFPKIDIKSKSMFNKYFDGKNSLTNNLNIHKRKKVFSHEKNIIKLLNDISLSISSSSSIESKDEKKTKFNTNFRTIPKYTEKEINMNKVLLNENEINFLPKRPERKSSTRLSVFVRNMSKINRINTFKIMKVKKKKKKNF